MSDYIPKPDAEFHHWLNNFMSALASRQEALGVTQQEYAALQAARFEWNNAFESHQQAQAAAAAASLVKQRVRGAIEDLTRATSRRVQTHPDIQNEDRAALGLRLRSTGRTRSPQPTTRAVALIDISQRLRHTINFGDEATPNSRAKPDGVRACEIWAKVDGPPPVSANELRFIGVSTSSPYVVEYDGADAGKVAHYMLRWVNTHDEKGPWSLTVSATVPS